MIGNVYNPKGSRAIEGELDKNGFTKATFTGGGKAYPTTAKISKDGNKLEFIGFMFAVELTRR